MYIVYQDIVYVYIVYIYVVSVVCMACLSCVLCVYVYDVDMFYSLYSRTYILHHIHPIHTTLTYSYDGHWTTPSLLPSEYKSTVYKIILQNATDNTAYNTIKQLYYTTTDNAEKRFAFTIGNCILTYYNNFCIVCLLI